MNEYPISLATDLSAVSSEALKEELLVGLQLTVKHLQYYARIWQELEKRGVDLSDIKSNLAMYLPAIAENSLSANAVLKFAGRTTLLEAVMKLPLESQDKLIEDNCIEIVKIDETGQQIVVTKQPVLLHPNEIRQVFDGQKVRNVEAQKRFLTEEPGKAIKKSNIKKTSHASIVCIDDIDSLRVCGVHVPVKVVIDILSKHYNLPLTQLRRVVKQRKRR